MNRVLSQSLPITGTTRLYLVIGDPIEQVQAPTLMNEIFERSGIDAVLAPLWVTAADFAAVLGGLRRTRNLDGILITVPHKAAAARLGRMLSLRSFVSEISNSIRPLALCSETERPSTSLR